MSSCLILCWATHKLWQELFDSHDFNLRVWKLWRISKLQILFNLPILIFDFASLIEYLLCPSCKYFKKMCQKNTNGERFRWHMYHCYSTGNRKCQPRCWLFLADTHIMFEKLMKFSGIICPDYFTCLALSYSAVPLITPRVIYFQRFFFSSNYVWIMFEKLMIFFS